MKPAQASGIVNSSPRPPRASRREIAPPVSPVGLAAWRMPSGMAMAEFAWRGGGFLAPALMKRLENGTREGNL